MSESLIYLIIFALLMFFVCGRHGGKGGCCGHSRPKNPDNKSDKTGFHGG